MYVLRPQQETFEDAIRAAFARTRTVLAVAPTGFGKGVVLADMASKAVEKGRKVLTVTNRRVIVTQLQEHMSRVGLHTGIIMGQTPRDPSAPAQVASIATLKRQGFDGLHDVGFVLIDEAHREDAAYRKLINEEFPGVPCLGMTATPVGAGGRPLSHFGEIVEPIRNSQVIEEGHLLPVQYIAPSEPDLGGIDLKRDSQKTISDRVDSCTIYGDVFAEWEPYKHMQTMVILPSRAICNGFYNECIKRGITAQVVDGTTPQEERLATFTEFTDTDTQMLLGVDVVREGLDLPIAQCLIDLQPTHQFRVYWQKIGRIKRPHAGQETAVVIDFAGNLWRHMLHPDQDPPWDELTNDETIEDVIEKKAGLRCPECGSKDFYGPANGLYKCEDCKHEWATKRPWVCPHCRQALAPYQKCVDGKCPNCGEKIGAKQVKRIRMADGSMRCVSADEIKRRKKSKSNSKQTAWDKWRYIAHHSGKALNFARAMYKKETGAWPNATELKYCPEKDSGDWNRKPGDVCPWMKKKRGA